MLIERPLASLPTSDAATFVRSALPPDAADALIDDLADPTIHTLGIQQVAASWQDAGSARAFSPVALYGYCELGAHPIGVRLAKALPSRFTGPFGFAHSIGISRGTGVDLASSSVDLASSSLALASASVDLASSSLALASASLDLASSSLALETTIFLALAHAAQIAGHAQLVIVTDRLRAERLSRFGCEVVPHPLHNRSTAVAIFDLAARRADAAAAAALDAIAA